MNPETILTLPRRHHQDKIILPPPLQLKVRTIHFRDFSSGLKKLLGKSKNDYF